MAKALIIAVAASAAVVPSVGPVTAASTNARPVAGTEIVPITHVANGAISTASGPMPLQRNRIRVALSSREADRWRYLVTPESADALRRVNFKRYGLLAVFYVNSPVGVAIKQVVRRSNTLILSLAVAPPLQLPGTDRCDGGICTHPDPACAVTPCAGVYAIVAIERKYLRSLLRLTVTREVAEPLR